jgi:predicted MFS family arabinose efflux permease
VGTAQAFGGPAYQALIPTLVDREDLPNAIALNSIQFNLARLIGPLVAGFLLEWAGPVYCFFLNGLSFVAVIVSLNMIRTRFRPQGSSNSVLRDIQLGLSYLLQRPSLWQLSVLGFVSAFCAIPLLTMLPVFADQIFGAEARIYSYMMACSGAGSVTGALLYAHFSNLKRRGRATLAVQLLFSGILASFALSRFLPLSFALLFAGGMSMMILIASVNSLVQLAVDEKMRGRVSSIFMLSFRGAMPLGNLLTGVMATAFSPAAALLVNSAVLFSCASIYLLAGSRVRRL